VIFGKLQNTQKDDFLCPFSGRIISMDFQGRLTNPDSWLVLCCRNVLAPHSLHDADG